MDILSDPTSDLALGFPIVALQLALQLVLYSHKLFDQFICKKYGWNWASKYKEFKKHILVIPRSNLHQL